MGGEVEKGTHFHGSQRSSKERVTWNSGLNFFMLRKIIRREMTSGPPTTAAVVTTTAAVATATIATAAVATAAVVIATAAVATAAVAHRRCHSHSCCRHCRRCHCRHRHRHRHRHHPFHLCHRVAGHKASQGEIMQCGFGGEMRCEWMDVHYRFSCSTSPQYIDRDFMSLTQKNHLEGFRLSHWRTLAVA
jgi:hypothetical protein